jgi:hypothetical protein
MVHLFVPIVADVKKEEVAEAPKEEVAHVVEIKKEELLVPVAETKKEEVAPVVEVSVDHVPIVEVKKEEVVVPVEEKKEEVLVPLVEAKKEEPAAPVVEEVVKPSDKMVVDVKIELPHVLPAAVQETKPVEAPKDQTLVEAESAPELPHPLPPAVDGPVAAAPVDKVEPQPVHTEPRAVSEQDRFDEMIEKDRQRMNELRVMVEALGRIVQSYNEDTQRLNRQSKRHIASDNKTHRRDPVSRVIMKLRGPRS